MQVFPLTDVKSQDGILVKSRLAMITRKKKSFSAFWLSGVVVAFSVTRSWKIFSFPTHPIN